MSPTPMRIAADENGRALPRKQHLTQASVERLTCPAGKPSVYVYDAPTPGLSLLLSKSGAKTWYWYGRVRGELRPVRHRIGDASRYPLADARKRAKAVGVGADNGINPNAANRQALAKQKAAVTVKQLWADYETYLKAECTANTVRVDSNLYKLHLASVTGRAVDTLTADDVVALHNRLKAAKSAGVAAKALRLLRRMLSWGGINPNPVALAFGGRELPKSKKLAKDAERTRFLTTEEMGRLQAALDATDNQTIADAIRLSLMTGARKGNVCGARWADIHLGQSLWIIPADQSKNKKPMKINLAPPALDLLTRRKAENVDKAGNEKSPYVFPGKIHGTHLKETKSTWYTVRKAAGIPDVHYHDLRHTLASWMAMAGVSPLLIGQQLGHQDRQSTHRYTHLAETAAAPAVAATVAAMFTPAKVKRKGKGK